MRCICGRVKDRAAGGLLRCSERYIRIIFLSTKRYVCINFYCVNAYLQIPGMRMAPDGVVVARLDGYFLRAGILMNKSAAAIIAFGVGLIYAASALHR